MPRRRPIVKLLFVLVGLAVLGVLFVSTLRDVTSTPYTVRLDDLREWTLEVDERTGSGGPALSLRPPASLSLGLSDQVFQRTMESFSLPTQPGIPLILRHEFEMLSGSVPLSELAELARAAGVEGAIVQPVCMAVYRTSSGREQRQFFALFDLPQLGAFRNAVAQVVGERVPQGAMFDPGAVSPVLVVAASEPGLFGQIPARDLLEQACEAPVIPE